MNELRKPTLTTLEVAEMMEVPHSDILKKLEGRKDRKGYIQVLAEGQMSVSDYFILSTYRDASGKENKCYEVTRLGCDFLANKFTGEKGVIFTARYVKRFHDMEETIWEGIPQKKEPDKKKKNLSATNMLVKTVSGIFKDAGVSALFIAAEAKRLYKEQADIDIQIPLITDSTTQKLWDCTSIAKELGIHSESGRPHDKAVSGIIQNLDIFSDEIVRTAYSRNGHDGITVQYKDSVLNKVREWLEENNYPTVINLRLENGNVNKCRVCYGEVA